MIKHRLRRLIMQITQIVFLSFIISGCGYTTRSMISNEYTTIYITGFTNKIDITKDTDSQNKYKIYRPMLETDITKAVIDKYLMDGNLKPVQKESADLILKGELVDFRKDPLRYTENDDVEEYRVNIVVNLSLWSTKKDAIVWTENGFTGQDTYFITGTQAKSEASAITAAISDLARRIVERTVEQW